MNNYILVGSEPSIIEHLNNFLKISFCKNLIAQNFCNNCLDCKNIENNKHQNIYILENENNKQYNISDISIIFENSAYQVKENQNIFFIIKNAEFLNINAANSLLKLLEEPPKCYNFILTTSKINQILPTIRSRCIVKELEYKDINDLNKNNILFKFFTDVNINLLKNFDDNIKSLDNNLDLNILDFLDSIYNYWHSYFKNALLENKIHKANYAKNIINLIIMSKNNLPMPGSNKIFLKNLFFNFINLKKYQN